MPRPAKPMHGVVRQRANGRWQVVITLPKDEDGNYPQLSKTFDTERDAETWRLEQTDPRRRPRVERGMTVATLLDRYLDHQEDRIAATTLHTYRQYARNRIVPTIGGITLDALTVDDVDDLYEELGDDGMAPSSVRQVHAILRSALSWGRKRRYVDMNVAVDADPPSVKKHKIEPPTVTEIQKLLAAADEHDGWFGVACRLAAGTGARRGTVASFRLSDFRFLEGEVLINRSLAVVQGKQIVKGLKADNGDWVPVGKRTLEVVADHVAALHERARVCGVTLGDDFYLFATDVACTQAIAPSALTNRWGKVRTAAGLPRVRFHDLRHYVATELLDAGYDPVLIANRLRWKSGAMLYDVYGHTRSAKAREAADHIDRSLG